MNINEIANIANNRQKLSKAKMWDGVKSILENYQVELDKFNCTNDIADLYNFFTKTPSKKPKSDIEWLQLAMGKQDIRHYLNYVYATNEFIVATDGHRLHMIKSNSQVPGYYDMNMERVDESASYPDITRLIPTGRKTSITVQSILGAEIIVTNPTSSQPAHEGIEIDGAGFNYSYIKDALAGFDSDKPIKMSKPNPVKAISFSQGDLTAIVMPMRLK